MFWERFSALCAEKGVKPGTVARTLGFSNALCSQWKKGDQNPSFKYLSLLADYFNVTTEYLSGKESRRLEPNVAEILPADRMYKRPLYASASAGFGAYANNEVIGWVPLIITNPYDVEDTICIKVQGDSMYPKIEDGDTVVVHKQDLVDSGDIAVVMLRDDFGESEGFVKKVEIGDDFIRLVSLNPEYPPKTLRGPDLEKVSIVGRVLGVNRSF